MQLLELSQAAAGKKQWHDIPRLSSLKQCSEQKQPTYYKDTVRAQQPAGMNCSDELQRPTLSAKVFCAHMPDWVRQQTR